MDPEVAQVFDFVLRVLPWVTMIVIAGVGGTLLSNWLKIRNGYPLSNSWGLPMHPKTDQESIERIKLLTSENAQLRAEVGSMKDRLETVERIVTDAGAQTASQIEALREPRNAPERRN